MESIALQLRTAFVGKYQSLLMWGGMDEWAMSCTELQRWAVVFRAFVFFSMFFGFADETRKNY